MIQQIIHKYNNKDSLYGNKLTNHLNMGLFALYKLGASEEQLDDFALSYIEHNHLPDLPEVKVVIDDSNFNEYLGQDGYYSSFIPYFDVLLEEVSIDEVVKKYINQLIDGAAGGAFHGIIRLGYAYELQDKEEVAKALAYLAEAYQSFEPNEVMQKATVIEPINSVLSLSTNNHFKNKEFTRPLIIGRMLDVYEDPEFECIVSRINIGHCNSVYFGELLLKLYALTGDFTMLHGFTSTHALRILSPLIDNYEQVLSRHWFHLQIAYLSTNCTEIKDIPFVNSLQSWQEIYKKVMKVKDVHTIKIVYSLYEQSKYAEVDSLYRTLAQIKVTDSF